MSQTTVLVGFAEALAAPETVWSLVDAGFRVVAFARRGRSSAIRHSRHVVCHDICPPENDLQASWSELQKLMTSLTTGANGAPRFLFPLDDKAVWLGSRAKLENGWLLAGPSGPAAELALNKCIQTQTAREAGFNVPSTAVVRTSGEIEAFAVAQGYPVILKASECVPVREGRVRSCKKWICADSAELQRALADWGERNALLVQPFVAGIGEGIFGLAAEDGIRALSAHRRLRMMNPQGSGSSACISQPVPEDLRPQVAEFIRRTNWRGLFMIECLRDREGKAWFVEFNARPWGSMSLSRRQGLEYPAWQIQLMLDPESPAGLNAPTDDGVVCRHAGREFMHLLFVLKGPNSQALDSWPSFWRSAGAVLHVGAKDTLYNWRGEDPQVFFADCWSTVKDNLFKSRA